MKPFGRRLEEIPPVEGMPRARPEAAAAPTPEALRLRLRTRIMEHLNSGAVAEMAPDMLRAELEPVIHEIAGKERVQLSARDQVQLAQELTDDMVGFGPLEPLLRDNSISDIMVNGPDTVFIERAGKLQKADVRFRDAEHAAIVAQKMVATIGRRVDESSPLCDARLPDGSRVNVVLPPLALDGACISIRKFTKKKLDFAAMVVNGSMVPAVARLLEIAARCRCNILVSGGTGSGKTTLLNALSRMIAHDERVVTIEDAAELQLQQPHVVRLETRTANLEGRGEIGQRELLRNALRMRPDRIIVGEVRGAEAYDMLQAMNTGHDGSISTGPRQYHARRVGPRREHGADGHCQPAGSRHPHPDRQRGRPDHPDRAHARRCAPHLADLRHLRHGRRGGDIERRRVVRIRRRECRGPDHRPLSHHRCAPVLRCQADLFRPGECLDGRLAERVTCPAF